METITRIAFLLEKQQPFAAWRLPNDHMVHLIEGGLKVFDAMKDQEGFVFHPFDVQELPVLILTGDKHASDTLGDLWDNTGSLCQEIEYEQYINQINRAVKIIRSGKLQKIVLSRIVEAPGLTSRKAAEAFSLLCERFPEAFVYLLSAGSHTRWMGATPEKLISFDGDSASTVSLAGTLPADSDLKWTEKEQAEQQIVTDYIVRQIQGAGATEVVVGQPFVIKAGKLLHLKTEIRFAIPQNLSRYTFVEALHPTPAVCGNPKDDARQMIASIEQHRRAYYTGFLGTWSTKGLAHLFVNLRCMEFSEHRSCLYVGGGITADSVPAREWAETTWKAGTLSWLFDAK